MQFYLAYKHPSPKQSLFYHVSYPSAPAAFWSTHHRLLSSSLPAYISALLSVSALLLLLQQVSTTDFKLSK